MTYASSSTSFELKRIHHIEHNACCEILNASYILNIEHKACFLLKHGKIFWIQN